MLEFGDGAFSYITVTFSCSHCMLSREKFVVMIHMTSQHGFRMRFSLTIKDELR